MAFAVAFDLNVNDTKAAHPKGVTQAYSDIANTLSGFGFTRIQYSVYHTPNEDLANLFNAMQTLKALGWIRHCVKRIHVFRVEQWSDFTSFMTG